MDITLATPALLFPAVSLLMLGYSTRFTALAALVRTLHASYRTEPNENLAAQIRNLRHRLSLARNMQAAGALTVLLAALCMLLLVEGYTTPGRYTLIVALVAMLVSIAYSLRENQLSVDALNVQLADMELDGRRS